MIVMIITLLNNDKLMMMMFWLMAKVKKTALGGLEKWRSGTPLAAVQMLWAHPIRCKWPTRAYISPAEKEFNAD